MPRIISDDGMIAQVQQDDGSIINIASQQAPGTLEYLQGIQNIKPYSGPGAPVGYEPPLAQEPAIDQGGGAFDNLISGVKDFGRRVQKSVYGEPAPEQPIQPVVNEPMAPSTEVGVGGPRVGREQVAPRSQASEGSTGLDQAFDQKIKAAQKAAEIGQQTAIAQKAQYDTMTSLFQQDAEKQAAMNEQRDIMLADRMSKYDKTMSDYSKMQVKNPWADASTGTKIGAALAMLVGAVGAGAAGQENLAMKVINQAIDKDIDLQLKNIDKKGNELGQQKGYLDMVRTQFADQDSRKTALRDMYLSSIEGRLKSIAANNEQLMANPRVMDTMADINLQRAKFRGEEMDRQASILEKMMKAQAGPELKPNQYTAAGYGQRLAQSEQVFQDLEAKGYNPSGIGAQIGRSLPDAVQSEDAKMQEQAERNFVNAVLRKESGAAISPTEFESAILQYFPRTADSNAVKEQKKQNRMIALRALQAEAGPAFNMVGAAPRLVRSGNSVYEVMPDGNYRQVR